MPLDVDKGIELPQLELISTKNDDCTTEYSTGNLSNAFSKSNMYNDFFLVCKCSRNSNMHIKPSFLTGST